MLPLVADRMFSRLCNLGQRPRRLLFAATAGMDTISKFGELAATEQR